MPSRRRAFLILASLCLLALVSFGLALMAGSFKVAPVDVLAALLGQEGSAGAAALPTKVVFAQYARKNAPGLGALSSSGFAALADESKLPFVSDAGRAGYRTYLTKSHPRAFAIAPNGAWAWADGGDDPLKRSVDNCNKRGKSECKLYSADDLVVGESK